MIRLPLINRFTCSPNQLPYFIDKIKGKQMRPIIENISENGKTKEKNVRSIINSIDTYPMNTFALKLSSLNIRDKYYDKKELIDSVYQICDMAVENDSQIIIDAEDININDEIDAITDLMMQNYNQDSVFVYKTYQMYRRDTMTKYLDDLTKDRNYYIGCKLVRGAYYNQDSHSDLLYWRIEDTHLSL